VTLSFMDRRPLHASGVEGIPMVVRGIRAPVHEFSRSEIGVRTEVFFSSAFTRHIRRRRTLKELLMAPEARTEELVPPREQYRLRPPPELD